MKKILLGLFLLSSVAFGKVQCKFIYTGVERFINKELEKLQLKGYTIIEVEFIENKGEVSEVIVVYDDNK